MTASVHCWGGKKEKSLKNETTLMDFLDELSQTERISTSTIHWLFMKNKNKCGKRYGIDKVELFASLSKQGASTSVDKQDPRNYRILLGKSTNYY